MLTFLQITFELRKVKKNSKHCRIPRVKTPQIIFILTPKRSIWSFDLGYVKGPDLINDPDRSACCISVDASYQDKDNDTSPMAQAQFCEEFLT